MKHSHSRTFVHSFVRSIDNGSDRELAYQQSTLKYEPEPISSSLITNETDKCSVLPSNVFHKKDKAFAIYSGECGSSFVLFDRVFRSLSMTYIRGSINQGRETFSEHSRDGQCTFVSLAALLFLAVEY